MLDSRNANALHFLLSTDRCPALPSSHRSLSRLVITWTRTKCTLWTSAVHTFSPHKSLSRLVITWQNTHYECPQYIHLHLTNHCLGWWSPGQNTHYEHLHLKNHCLSWWSPGQGQNTHYEHPQYILFHLTSHCLGWWSPRHGTCTPWVSTNYTAMPSSPHKSLSMHTEPPN